MGTLIYRTSVLQEEGSIQISTHLSLLLRVPRESHRRACEQKAVYTSGGKHSPIINPDGIENSQLPATHDNNCLLFKPPRPM